MCYVYPPPVPLAWCRGGQQRTFGIICSAAQSPVRCGGEIQPQSWAEQKERSKRIPERGADAAMAANNRGGDAQIGVKKYVLGEVSRRRLAFIPTRTPVCIPFFGPLASGVLLSLASW